MILDEKEANFNLMRINFDMPFSASIWGHNIYKGEQLYNLLVYKEEEDCYFYEDELVSLFTPLKPTENYPISLDVKPVNFGIYGDLQIFVSCSVEKIKEPENSFICFEMIGKSRKEIYSGYLVTLDHYAKTLKIMNDDENMAYYCSAGIDLEMIDNSEEKTFYKERIQIAKGALFPRGDFYKDMIVEKITKESLNEIFTHLEEMHKTQSYRLRRIFGEVEWKWWSRSKKKDNEKK